MSEEANEKKSVEGFDAEVVPENGNACVSSENRMLGMLCVLSQFLCYFSGFGGLIVPLIIWLLKKDSSQFIDRLGRETVNFHITFLILVLISGIFCVVLIGYVLLALLCIYFLVTVIVAAVKASDGVVFRYPICFRFIR